MSDAAQPIEQTVVRPKRRPESSPRPKRQPPHAVVLHNDELNSMPFVVSVLQKVFGYERAKAVDLMLGAHDTGRAIVWSGTKELAELKAEQVESCGPDPIAATRGAGPLRVSVEPLPGE
ncbi:ATP-dependent Clp protease adaptor ClpS [Botrimarina sp.]|uniref:ATP-dependent Clp protease adaptor ClpS n=1 Tax=Botrimarina sp. TaxID=2795802 RepID=UPI0032EB7756